MQGTRGRPLKALDDLRPRSLRQRARRLAKATLAKYTGGQELQQFQEDFLGLMESPTGKRLLSEVCANLRVSKDHRQVIQNFKKMVNDVMKPKQEGSTKRKNSTYAGAVASAFGANTSYAFLEDELNIPRGLARKWRSLAKKKGKFPDFLTASYPSGVHRNGMLLQIKAAPVTFFKSQTYILSGAKRDTRNLGISKSELERRLYAFFPESCVALRGRTLYFWNPARIQHVFRFQWARPWRQHRLRSSINKMSSSCARPTPMRCTLPGSRRGGRSSRTSQPSKKVMSPRSTGRRRTRMIVFL